MKCGTCRFWDNPNLEYADGYCRRWPPLPLRAGVDDMRAWKPVTHADEWCGEYQRQPKPVPPPPPPPPNVSNTTGDVWE